MTTEQKKGDGFGAIALCILIGCFCPVSGNYKYHVSRFFGLGTKPTSAIIEIEIERAATATGVKKEILKALVDVESGGNHLAESRVGARGVTQIMPFNAKRCGLKHADDLWDAVFNIRCGAKILSEEINTHKDLHKALTVYNCGKTNCMEGKKYATKVISISKRYS